MHEVESVANISAFTGPAAFSQKMNPVSQNATVLPETRITGSIAGIFPLSFAQESLWLEEQLSRGSAYNLPEAWRLTGHLDLESLSSALTALVRRHETLRTLIRVDEGGKPIQVVLENGPFPLQCQDIEAGGELPNLLNLMRAEASRPFDLESGPLIRGVLYRLGEKEHVLLVTLHHMVSDAWSQAVLIRDLSALYSAAVLRQPAQMPELPIQFADFAVWQRERSSAEAFKNQLNYWRNQLGGTLASCSPAPDFQRGEARRGGATEFTTFDPELVSGLSELSRQNNATLFMTLLAGFKTLLHRYTGTQDILVGCPMAGRNRAETERLIGMLVNTGVFRTNLEGNPTFTELLRRVRGVALDAFSNQDVSLGRIASELKLERQANRNPLFDVVFGLQTEPAESIEMAGLEVERIELDNGSAKFDWTLLVTRTANGLSVRSEYDTALYRPSTARRLARHYEMLLREIVACPSKRLSEFALITPEERRQTIIGWNNTCVPYERDSTVHELFEAQAKLHPDRTALKFEGRETSYTQLNRRADEVAAFLKQQGVKSGSRVGLCFRRSPAMITALIGTLKSGASYVPLDPEYPEERLALMLRDSAAEILLTDSFRPAGWRPLAGATPLQPPVCSLRPAEQPAEPSLQPSACGLQPAEQAAYVMYTSGSTGVPKGVEVSHRAIVRLVRNNNYVQINQGSVFLQFASASFDASTFEIWGALLNGAKLVILSPEMPSLTELGGTIASEGVDILWLTAGLFNQMVDHEPKGLAGVRQLLTGGEALSVPHVLKALRSLPDCTIINGYGPTENTTFSCCYRIPSDWVGGASVPIGRPIANSQVYILDQQREPCPVGVPGEIWVGGDGLARGYIGQPGLTAERFIVHPIDSRLGSVRLYRTGDRGRWLEDGSVEFLGRIDDQVKLRGFRIEPGEIESVLRTHPGVRGAVVKVDGSGLTRRLVAYVISELDQRPEIPNAAVVREDLLAFLGRKLPSHMVPSAVVEVRQFPLTLNGKIDRAALPPPPEEHLAEPVSPRDEREKLVSQIWQEVLGRNGFDVRQNFFHLGGHSLLAIQIASRLSQILKVAVPVRTLFECPTIEGFAAALPQPDPDAAPEQPLVPRKEIALRGRARELLDRLDELSDDEIETLLGECDPTLDVP